MLVDLSSGSDSLKSAFVAYIHYLGIILCVGALLYERIFLKVDLNKKEVYNLSKWKNRNNEIIPKNIINKKPSAELAPEQYDPFDYDKISPVVDDIILGSNVPVENIDLIKIVNINEHKRRQAAPVLRVSKKAFGIGRRIPIVNHFND